MGKKAASGKKKRKAGKKNVVALGFVSFFTDVSSEMIFSILPFFLANTLGLSKTMIGLIQGVADGFANIVKVFSGWLSDSIKKRKLIVFAGYLVSAVSKPIIALSTGWWHVLAARLADRLGKGVRSSPREALLTESTVKHDRGRWFGFDTAMDKAGAIVGTLVAYILVSAYFNMDYRTVFLLSIIPAAIALLIIIFFIQDYAYPRMKSSMKKFSLSLKEYGSDYKYFLVVAVMFNLANFTYAFFLLKAQELGFAAAAAIILYLVYNIFLSAMSIPAGRWSDTIDRRKVILLGYGLFALSCVGFIISKNKADIWVLFAMYGISIALTEGVSKAYVGDLAPKNRKASAQGIYNACSGVAMIAGGIFAGFLWDNMGSFYAFFYAALLAGIACMMLILGRKRLG